MEWVVGGGIFRAALARSGDDGDGDGGGAGQAGLGPRRVSLGDRACVWPRSEDGADVATAWAVFGACRARGGLAARPESRLDRPRAPEVDVNASVLHRELCERGFTGSVIIVRRALVPLRAVAAPTATVRFETAPGEQAQVDFGQARVWIAEERVAAQIFVMTLGFSRRCFPMAFARQRLHEWHAGHEQAFQHFGGVTDTVVMDNAKAMVLAHTRGAITWHPTYADFAGYYGFRPWACAPYRPQTKGKVESGVK